MKNPSFVKFIFIDLSSEKSSELADSAKQTAHDAGVKAQEVKESTGEKLEAAGKTGKSFSSSDFLIFGFQ